MEYFIGLALIGIIAGFASGLLGVGGGFIFVPLQFFLLKYIGVDPSLAMLISLGTSLAIIIPTASSGAYMHIKTLKNIKKPGLKLGLFGIFGGVIGGFTATIVDLKILEVFFGLLLLFVAFYNLITLDKGPSKPKLKMNLLTAAILGLLVGFSSGLLGIGGGFILVIVLVILFAIPLIEAIGISSVFISLTAFGGLFSYIVTGLGVNTFPYSIGYISLVNFVTIICFSTPLAYYGAKISHKINEKRLKQVFSIVLLYIGLKMLGILF